MSDDLVEPTHDIVSRIYLTRLETEVKQLRAHLDRANQLDMERIREIERLRLSCKQWEADALRYCQNAGDARNTTIEECARVAELWLIRAEQGSGEDLIDTIRALKDKR